MYPCSEPGLSKAFCLVNKNVVNTSYIFNIFLKVVEKKKINENLVTKLQPCDVKVPKVKVLLTSLPEG